MSYIWATQDFKVDSNNVHKCECDQFKLNNSGTAELHVMLLIVIIIMIHIRLSNTRMEKKSILKFSPSTSKKRYSNSEWGRTSCQSITVKILYLELIDIVHIVTNQSWVMRFTFYMNVQS